MQKLIITLCFCLIVVQVWGQKAEKYNTPPTPIDNCECFFLYGATASSRAGYGGCDHALHTTLIGDSQVPFTWSFPHYHLQNFPFVGIENLNSNYRKDAYKSTSSLFAFNRIFIVPERLFSELLYMKLDFENERPKGKVKTYQLSQETAITSLNNGLIFDNATTFMRVDFDSSGNFLSNCSYAKVKNFTLINGGYNKYSKPTYLQILSRKKDAIKYRYTRLERAIAMQPLKKNWSQSLIDANKQTSIFIEVLLNPSTEQIQKISFDVYAPKHPNNKLRIKEIHYSEGEQIDTQRHYFYTPHFTQNKLLESQEFICWHCIADTTEWQLIFTSLHDKKGRLVAFEHTYWKEKIRRIHAYFFLFREKNCDCQLNTLSDFCEKGLASPAAPYFDATFRIAYNSEGQAENIIVCNETKYLFLPDYDHFYPHKRGDALLDYCKLNFNYSEDDAKGNWQEARLKPVCNKELAKIKRCDCCPNEWIFKRKIRYYPDE